MKEILFWFFSGITLVSALNIVFTRNLVRAGFALFVCLCGIATLFVFAGSDFLAATQLVVYVGGILILILFGVMLSKRNDATEPPKIFTARQIPAVLICLSLFIIFIVSGSRTNIQKLSPNELRPSTEPIGFSLLTENILVFEAISVILLVALIGAAFLSRK